MNVAAEFAATSIAASKDSMTVIVASRPRWRVRDVVQSDYGRLCSWVPDKNALHLVSGDQDDCLTPAILSRWLAQSHAGLIITRAGDNDPLGFCTLSTHEVPQLPRTHVELGHLVVNPHSRFLSLGASLSCAAIDLARGLGFRVICARILPGNKYALALAQALRASEISCCEPWLPPGFRWFQINLFQHDRCHVSTENGWSALRDGR